jgi:signal transduction histidine kinase
MRIFLTLFLTWLIYGHNAFAQLRLSLDGHSLNTKKAEIYYLLTPDTSDHFIKSKHLSDPAWRKLPNLDIPISHSPYVLWLKIKAFSETPINYVHINNPHINFLHGWIVDQDSIIQDFGPTGDNLNYNTRPLPTNDFVFPVQELGNSHHRFFILKIDKRYTKLELPISFCSNDYFLKEYYSNNLLNFIFLGVIAFVFILHVYLFISVRERLYLWYSIYLLCFISALLTEAGLGFMYLYPYLPSINDLARPIIISVSIIPMLLFFNDLLQLKSNAPFFYRYNRFVITLYSILAILAIATSINDHFQTQGIWLNIQRILSPIILFSMIYQAFKMYRKGIPLSIFALSSLVCSTIFISMYIAHQADILPYSFFTKYALFIGLAADALIMSMALTWKFKRYKKQAEINLIEQKKQEIKLTQELSSYQKKEMMRIYSMLHDSLGARIGLLRIELEKMPIDENARKYLTDQIQSISQEIRQLSHDFSPVLLQEKGLYQSILHSVQLISINKGIEIQFEWIGENKMNAQSTELIIYRIVQELLQNLVKHASAKQVNLQIIPHEEMVSIYYEDDGKGSKNWLNAEGTGIKNMKQLVEILNGNMIINSMPQEGFSVSIEFKPTSHETT